MTLKELLSPELYGQVQARIDEVNAGQTDKTKHVRFADLSEGGYVSVDKHNSQVNTLMQQVNDLTGQITKRDGDITDLQGKLTAAQADASKLSDVQATLDQLQQQYTTDRQNWEQQTAAQKYEFAVKTAAGKLNFTSEAARREFTRGAIEKKMQMEGDDKILGFSDYVEAYKQADPGAFMVEQPNPQGGENGGGNPPQIVLPKTNPQGPEANAFGFRFNGVRPNPADK